jgi:hypothetical protein
MEEQIKDILKNCTVSTLTLGGITTSIVKLPEGKLERDVYEKVAKALKNINGQWKGGKTMGFVFQQANYSGKFPRAKRSTSAINYCKKNYTPETNPRMTVDSAWSKTLIKSDGFLVSGHSRMQPVGEGSKYRKLIWIDTFEKEGYTREAKMLNHNK